MNCTIKSFDQLTVYELYEILRLRQEAFIVEQGGRYQDLDQIDYESLHIFFTDDNQQLLGCVRIFPKPDEVNTVQIGRLVTRIRHEGLGQMLMEKAAHIAHEYYHSSSLYLTGRRDAKNFYLKCGYEIVKEHEHYFEFRASILNE